MSAWGNWVLEEAKKELARFYPQDPDGSIPVGYIWARTLPCQNPSCGAEIPLMRQTWLAKKGDSGKGKQIALILLPDRANRKVHAAVVQKHAGSWRVIESPSGLALPSSIPIPQSPIPDFDPGEGTVSRAHVRCPVCGATIDDATTRRLFREGKAGQRMMAVVLSPRPQGGRGAGGEGGKRYRLATPADEEAYRHAAEALEAKRQHLMAEWGLDPVPDEPLPPLKAHRALSQLPLYGMNTWGDLFNARQKLSLITFADKVRQAHAQMLAGGLDPEFAKAIATYLAIIFDRLADKNSNLVIYNVVGEKIEHVFGRQALPMVWDYIEVDPFTEVGWPNMGDWVEQVLAHLTCIPPVEGK